jgi:hypothetical protein
MLIPHDPWPDLVARLGPATLAILRRRGFVSIERRASGAVRYRLCWREGGQQQTVELGSDPEVALAVHAAVTALQRPRREERERAQRARQIRSLCAQAKRLLQTELESAGLRFHGFAARRPGHQTTAPTSSPLPNGDLSHDYER